MHIATYIMDSMIAMAMRLAWKISGRLLVKIHLYCHRPVAWALLLMCVWCSCGMPQQHWPYDACGMACHCGMSPMPVPTISIVFGGIGIIIIVFLELFMCSILCWKDSINSLYHHHYYFYMEMEIWVCRWYTLTPALQSLTHVNMFSRRIDTYI